MARPTKNTIAAGQQSWDALVNSNFNALFTNPTPIPLHTGNESDLQSTFPANQYDKCFIWVVHTTRGNTLYVSDGTTWSIVREVYPGSVNTSTTISAADYDVIRVDGTSAVTINLPPVANNNRRTLRIIKTGASGNITIDGNASETINGATTLVFSTQWQQVWLFCDGTQWLAKT
jgi:hypothetical protein